VGSRLGAVSLIAGEESLARVRPGRAAPGDNRGALDSALQTARSANVEPGSRRSGVSRVQAVATLAPVPEGDDAAS
jgi:hypothetical protein